MIRKNLLALLVLLLVVAFTIPAAASGIFQECPPEECPPDEDEGDGEYCEINPEECEEEGGGTTPPDDDDGDSGPPWDGYTDGRISPDPAEYYTIYCHEGTDTIYVIRVVPETETIKEISLADAISLEVGHEQSLGDNMLMERSSEDIITIYGSNGNLAPEPGLKSFNLNDCIESNGGPPEQEDNDPPTDNDDGGDPPEETEEEARRRRRQEAEDALDFCYASYDFFGGDADLLVDCLDFVLGTHRDVLTGIEIFTLIIMVFCLNIIVGNGVLPIGVVLFLGWHRRWLRKQKTL